MWAVKRNEARETTKVLQDGSRDLEDSMLTTNGFAGSYDTKHDIVFYFAEPIVQLVNYRLDQRSLNQEPEQFI